MAIHDATRLLASPKMPPRAMKRPAGYRMAAKGKTGEVYLYGPIGFSWFGDAITAKMFADDLATLRGVDTIDLRINSEGGDVFDATAMYTRLRDHGARIVAHVDGMALSAASMIAMAGDEIVMAEGAWFMIHNVWSFAIGEAKDMRRTADLLDGSTDQVRKIYQARTGQTEEALRAMMDEETWLNSSQALEAGFCDSVVENFAVAASLRDAGQFQNVPATLRSNRIAAMAKLERMRAAPAA